MNDTILLNPFVYLGKGHFNFSFSTKVEVLQKKGSGTDDYKFYLEKGKYNTS